MYGELHLGMGADLEIRDSCKEEVNVFGSFGSGGRPSRDAVPEKCDALVVRL